MRVVIAGGSGLIGRTLIERLIQARYEVTGIYRDRRKKLKNILSAIDVEFWEVKPNNTLIAILDGAGAVINLSGESIGARRWTKNSKGANSFQP